MPFTLKDKVLQEKLDEISNGDFSKRLNDTYIRSIYPFDGLISINFGPYVEGLPRFNIHIDCDDIDRILEFNPNDWNPFPDVKPPEDVQMRCITQTGMGFMLRYVDGEWLDNRNDVYDENGLEGAVTLFRPWE